MKEEIEILISEDELNKKIEDLANQISESFKDKDLTLICVLKGGIMFMVDIAKKLKQKNIQFEFMDVSSYCGTTESTGNLTIHKDLECSLENKHAILIEDIVDSGRTLSYLKKYLESKNPASLKVCTLLDKPSRRIVKIEADYVGFTIPDKFVIGYGLDYEQRYRNLPYIGVLTLK